MSESLGPLSIGLLIIPAIALRIAVHALYGRQRTRVADPLHDTLSMASTLMLVMGILGLGIGLFVVLLLFLPVVLIIGLMAWDRTRRAHHTALITTLAAAADQGVPLPEAARAFADEMQGDAGARSLALAHNLESGRTLAQSVRAARLRMGTATRLTIRLGESLGMLGPAMRQQLEGSRQFDDALGSVLGRFFYLGLVIIVLTSVSTFVMLRIVPVFERMFEEFELELPAMTQRLIQFANNSGFVYLLLLILTIPLFIVAIGLAALSVTELLNSIWPADRGTHSKRAWLVRSSVRSLLAVVLTLLLLLLLACLWPMAVMGFFFMPIVLYYIGWLPRDFPIVWRLFRRYDGALVMRGLALAVRRQLPMVAALDVLAEQYPLGQVARRCRLAADRVRQGMPWTDSLRQTRLISSADAAVLAAAERAGNVPWALEQMADSALRRQVQRMQMLLHVTYPAALLLLGYVVFFFVVGLFLPLVALIQGLV